MTAGRLPRFRSTGMLEDKPPTSLDLPLWVRLLDAATTTLAGFGLLLEVIGGPQFTLAGFTISMKSGVRPLLFASGLTLVRHLLFRGDPLHRRLLDAYERRPRNTFTTTILPAFLTTRIAVLLVGYLAVKTIGFPPDAPPPSGTPLDGLSQLMLRWDAGWYYQIADAGYIFDLASQKQQNIAFFPAYPLMMRYVGHLLGDRFLVAGLIVSLFAFLGALVYVFRLACEFMDKERAATAVLLLTAYPFAVFYGAVYTESMFLLGTVGAFYHLSRGECWRAAAWGLLVGLTRPNGFVVSAPLLLVALRPFLLARTQPAWRWMWKGQSSDASLPHVPIARHLAARVLAAAGPTIGMLVFAAYVQSLTGDALAWARVQAAWGRSFQGIAGVVSGPFRQLVEFGILTSIRTMPFETLNSAAALFTMVAIWPVTRRFGLALGMFLTLGLVVPLMFGGVFAIGRMTSVLFPVSFWLASAVSTRRLPLWVFGFSMGQAIVAALFFTWRQML